MGTVLVFGRGSVSINSGGEKIFPEEVESALKSHPDVFDVVNGTGETGGALVDEVDYMHFTGSDRTGRIVMKRAADTLTPVSLELGGKDPMIVLADADLERAANSAAYWSMFNSGQTCIAWSRLLVLYGKALA